MASTHKSSYILWIQIVEQNAEVSQNRQTLHVPQDGPVPSSEYLWIGSTHAEFRSS